MECMSSVRVVSVKAESWLLSDTVRMIVPRYYHTYGGLLDSID